METRYIFDEQVPAGLMEIHLNPQHQAMEVTANKEIIFLQMTEILFIEISQRQTYIHTKDKVYRSRLTLHECLEILPDYFQQIGKSQIANVLEIASINRSFSSTPKISFSHSSKETWVSRNYYKTLLAKKRSLL